MLKKLAAGAATTIAALALAVPAFASLPSMHMHMNELTLSNYAHVDNDVTTKANSGLNSLGGAKVHGGHITTDMATAGSQVDNGVNSNQSSCGCDSHGKTTLKNMAYVDNNVTTKANTGLNSIHGMVVGGGSINTGEADATSIVSNVVNSNVVE
jgi:hypothetical protein